MKRFLIGILLILLFPFLALGVEQGTFYASNVATIGDDETHATDSATIDVSRAEVIAVQIFFTGASACVATTVVKFVGRPSSTNGGWDDDANAFATITVIQTASTTSRKSALLDVTRFDQIRITSIENTEDDDINGDITEVNCVYAY